MSSGTPTARRGRAVEPPLPPHRGPRERAVIRAAWQGALPALRIDAQLERRPLAAARAEAVAQPVVPPHLGRPDADPRRPRKVRLIGRPLMRPPGGRN